MRYSRPRPAFTLKHRTPSGWLVYPKDHPNKAMQPRFVILGRPNLAAMRARVAQEAEQFCRSQFDHLLPVAQAEPGAIVERGGIAMTVTETDKALAAERLYGASTFAEYLERETATRYKALASKYGHGEVGNWRLLGQAVTEAEAQQAAEFAQQSQHLPVVEVLVEPLNFGTR